MPFPRLDFAVHDRRGQTVFVLELDPVRTRGAQPTYGPLIYLPRRTCGVRQVPSGVIVP